MVLQGPGQHHTPMPTCCGRTGSHASDGFSTSMSTGDDVLIGKTAR